MRTLEQFGQWADLFPETILLVDTDGVILAMNAAARRRLSSHEISAGQTTLLTMCAEPRGQLQEYLRACIRTRTFLPGAFSLVSANGEKTAYRAEGALYAAREEGAPAQLLLRLMPRESAASRFVALNQKIDELSREVERRRRVELALEDEHRHKDEFLAMLGHELRNPLAPIRAALELTAFPQCSDEMRQRAQDIMTRQVDHLTYLVDELLDVARIATGKITLNKVLVDVASIIERAAELCAPMMRENEQQLVIERAGEPLFVYGDVQRLTQTVGNLLNNAAKYTQSGGCIRVETLRRGDQVEIVVRDNGIGIHPTILPRIFDVFSQSARTLARSEGGLGVGLTLVRRLVEQHGGSVDAMSDGPGKGSEFRLALPLAAKPHDEERHAIADKPAAALPGRRILVVDDNPDAAETLGELLRLLGHETFIASNGEEGIASAVCHRPHAAFLDIGLPGMDGYMLARALRARPETAKMMLIALTGYGQSDDMQKTREAGFDHHLVKPARVDRINEVLASIG